MLINSPNKIKHEAYEAQQPKHINKISEEANTVQPSDSLMPPINQHFPNG